MRGFHRLGAQGLQSFVEVLTVEPPPDIAEHALDSGSKKKEMVIVLSTVDAYSHLGLPACACASRHCRWCPPSGRACSHRSLSCDG
jgi:hypothetical protein